MQWKWATYRGGYSEPMLKVSCATVLDSDMPSFPKPRIDPSSKPGDQNLGAPKETNPHTEQQREHNGRAKPPQEPRALLGLLRLDGPGV